MAYIELHETLPEHPKTEELAELLGISTPHAAGLLIFLWVWAMRYAQDGRIGKYKPAVIARKAGWTGDPEVFLGALEDAGWIDGAGEDRRIHDWDDYAGRLMEKREANAKRMRDARAKRSGDSHDERAENVQRTCVTRAGLPNLTKPNQIMIPPTPQGVPADAGVDEVPFEGGEPHQEEADPELTTRPAPKPGRVEYPEEFEALWKAHVGPRKGVDKGLALKRWKAALSRGVTSEEIVEAHKRFLASAGWVKDGGEFVPGLAVWLNGTPWDDYPEPARGPAVTLAPIAVEPDPWASHPWFEHYREAKTKDCAWHRLVDAGGVSGKIGGAAWKLKMAGDWLGAMDLLWQEVHGVRDAS